MPAPSAQQILFQHLKDNLPAHLSLVDTIAEVLHVSNDSAYRRIRGETPISLDELKVLCSSFKLSIDHLLQVSGNTVLFEITNIDNNNYTFEQYLSDILQRLLYISGFAEKEIVYVSKDIPLPHYFHNPVLLAFKHFFWMKTILQHPDYQKKTFVPGIDAGVSDTAGRILKTYNEIPSVEIWNIECINSTLQQIDFYKDAKVFGQAADMVALYDALEDTIVHVQKQAEYGAKFRREESPELKAPNFRLFFNQVILGDNTILVKTGSSKAVIVNNGILNYMITRDDGFCEFTERELNNVIRRSTLISSVSEKQRSLFFESLRKKIDRGRKSV